MFSLSNNVRCNGTVYAGPPVKCVADPSVPDLSQLYVNVSKNKIYEGTKPLQSSDQEQQ